MLEDGVPTSIVELPRELWEYLINVRIYGELTELIEIAYGVRQGCLASPTLFNYIIDWVMKNALKEDDGVGFSAQEKIADIEYTDDGTLLADSAQKAWGIPKA